MEDKELYYYMRNGMKFLTPSLAIAYKRSDEDAEIEVLTL
jgi:hypothetical protein